MSWVAGLLCLLFLLGGLRNRGKLEKLAQLPPSDEPPEPGVRFLLRGGVVLGDAERRAATAYARAAELEVVELIPGDWPAMDLLGLAELTDPLEYRLNALARGMSAGHAVLVAPTVFERLRPQDQQLVEGGSASHVELMRLAVQLKKSAPRRTGVAVCPGLRAVRTDPAERREILRCLFGDFVGVVLLLQGVVFGLILLTLWLSPVWGAAALVCFHLQVLLAMGGTSLGRRSLWPTTLLRLPLELWQWSRTVFSRPARTEEPAEVTALRPVYAALIEKGVESFFEPRRSDCPYCGAEDLVVQLVSGDYIQHKVGRFTLERCRACGHVFQNPRLTPEGLDYYYRDFYDGLSAEKLDFVFGFNPGSYLERARALSGCTKPKRWLDVGGGHGHFCLIAKEDWPETSFEVLDFSDSVADAERCGWADKGWKGFFPDLAEQLQGRYEVISMSHYLEHTREPEVEIETAARVLNPGGHLMIEVPDPESAFGRWLGWTWLPWFQPQHLHMLPIENLERLLEKHGFETVERDRAGAHQKVDFTYSALMILSRLSRPVDMPWLPPDRLPRRVGHDLVWLVGLPFLIMGMLVDRLAAPFVKRFGLSNTYRVAARKA